MIQTPGFFWTVLFFLLAIGPLVFVHELGHYLVARWCGVKSDVFSIGFGREILGWTDKRGTRWKVGWLPLGGYVRFAGDMNAVSQPDATWKSLPDAERNSTFPAQPVWKRFLIVFAGPAANFIAAFLIFAALIGIAGDLRAPNVVGGVSPKSAAERAGFLPGDRIETVDGRTITQFADIGGYVMLRPHQMMTFSIVRAGKPLTIVAAPDDVPQVDRFGNKSSIGMLGMRSLPPTLVKVPLHELPGAAVRKVGDVLRTTVDALGQMVTGKRSLQQLSGPIGTAQLAGQIATLGWMVFLSFVAFVSINLGFINLLPVPMLDGGHLFFYTIEAAIRRPVTERAQEWAFRLGFALVVSLMLFATFNDLDRNGIFGRLAG